VKKRKGVSFPSKKKPGEAEDRKSLKWKSCDRPELENCGVK
jgi:hypothetical protein